jgi:hypothetical protein
MQITTRITWDIDGNIVDHAWFDYEGPVALLCGATAGQNAAATQTGTFMSTMQNQSSAVFGDSSQIFSDINAAFAPIVANGPNQEGFSPAEKSAMDSSVVDTEGQAARNAKAATGNAVASAGGGNTTLPSGTAAGIEADTEQRFAQATASGENQVVQADYATGRQNFDEAAQVLGGATNSFGAATGEANAATGAAGAATTAANDVATAQNSWMTPVAGILGGVAGMATGGMMKNLGAGVGAFGQDAPAPGSNG